MVRTLSDMTKLVGLDVAEDIAIWTVEPAARVSAIINHAAQRKMASAVQQEDAVTLEPYVALMVMKWYCSDELF